MNVTSDVIGIDSARPQGLEQYRSAGFLDTEGWVNPKALDHVATVESAQGKIGVEGGAMEIGVYHGRFFMALNSVATDGFRSIAIDLFDDQQLNIDGSTCMLVPMWRSSNGR